MTYQKNKNRIRYLEKEYSEYHMNSDELITPSLKATINRNYRDLENIRMVDWVLGMATDNVQKLIKKEVYQICKTHVLKELCSRCKVNQIIAAICIYVWKRNNSNLIIDDNIFWKEYNLTWEKYAKIITNLLIKTRQKNRL